MISKCLKFAPCNKEYKTGIHAFNMDNDPIKLKMIIWHDMKIVSNFEYELMPKDELIFYLPDYVKLDPDHNCSIFLFSSSDFNPYTAYVTTPNGGLLPCDFEEVTTELGN